jgi:hypothetical protein
VTIILAAKIRKKCFDASLDNFKSPSDSREPELSILTSKAASLGFQYVQYSNEDTDQDAKAFSDA